MTRFFLLLIIITIPSSIFCQDSVSPLYLISGKIIDASTRKPLVYATISFIEKKSDSTDIKYGGITNEKGFFSIEVEKGDYRIIAEFISYKQNVLNLSSITKNMNLGTIELEQDSRYLDEIEITAEKKTLEIKANKLVFNVDKDISAAGGMATDVLNNIPSISLESNGTVMLRGQSAVVMINGKVSSMSKTEALKVLPGGSIDKIEVISNPGARYSASYSGIVNIILKKGKDNGLNASITTTVGYKDVYGGLLNLNYKTKKINFFTNTSFFNSNPIKTASFENEYFNNNVTTSFLNEYSKNNNKNNGVYSTVGLTFYLSKRSSLTTKINYTDLNYKNRNITDTHFFNASQAPTESNEREYLREFKDDIMEYVVEFEQNFKKEGQHLTVSFSYYDDLEKFNHTVNNTNINFTDENYTEKNKFQNSDIDIKYGSPTDDSSNFLIGYKGEFGNTFFSNTEETNNNFIEYFDDIHAVFAEFEHQGDKFYYRFGLRAEFSQIDILYTDLGTALTNTHNDFFPSVYLDYTLNDQQNINMSYSRGIIRPSYIELQPFEEKISEISFFRGNEQIEPVYFDLIDLSYSLIGKKITFMPRLFFNKYHDYWQNVTYKTGELINSVDKTLTTPVNLGHVDYYGLDLTTVVKAGKHLEFTANILLYNFDQKGVFETPNLANATIILDYNQSSFNGNFSLLAKLKIPELFSFQTSLKHFLKSKGPYSVRKANTFANVVMSKDILNDNSTISLIIDDIFKSNKTKRNRFDDHYFSRSHIENKYRNIKLSFTYRFNQSKRNRKIDFDKKKLTPNY